jgi:hypothetical protein
VSAAAVIILRRKKFIRRFAEQDATSPQEAIPFDKVGMRRSVQRVDKIRQHPTTPSFRAFDLSAKL